MRSVCCIKPSVTHPSRSASVTNPQLYARTGQVDSPITHPSPNAHTSPTTRVICSARLESDSLAPNPEHLPFLCKGFQFSVETSLKTSQTWVTHCRRCGRNRKNVEAARVLAEDQIYSGAFMRSGS